MLGVGANRRFRDPWLAPQIDGFRRAAAQIQGPEKEDLVPPACDNSHFPWIHSRSLSLPELIWSPQNDKAGRQSSILKRLFKRGDCKLLFGASSSTCGVKQPCGTSHAGTHLFVDRGGARHPKLRRPRTVRAFHGVERRARECRTREDHPCGEL